MAEDWLDELAWDDRGLLPALAQDHGSGELLMQGWLSRQALILTVARGQAVFCRPESGECWQPAAEAGGPLRIVEIRSDRGRERLLLKVRAEGWVAGLTPLFDWRLLEARWQPQSMPAAGSGR